MLEPHAPPPARWIPPEFRQFVTRPLAAAQAQALVGMCRISENGVMRNLTVEEIQAQFPQVTGVLDTRDGSFYPTQANTPSVLVGD